MSGTRKDQSSGARPVDAQRIAVPGMVSPVRPLALALLLALLLVPVAQASEGGDAVVSGVVRDARGVAQMGALVQVLAADSITVATAFTDFHGRYVIANLHPGRYLVRASATLFVPATRANLRLVNGASAVVNLTMATLFDTSAWLPAQRRRADEPDDDWKWTLRSTAGRPILRVLNDDGTTIQVSSSATEETRSTTSARATVTSGDGEFGGGGIHNTLALHRGLDSGGDMMLRADIGTTRVPAAYGPSAEFDAGVERKSAFGGAQRTVLSYRDHPELMASGITTGLEVFELTSAQRMAIGDQVEIEAGGSIQAVHTSAVALASRPFVRIAAHPGGVADGWTAQYRMSTDRDLQGFEDVTSARSEIPVALAQANGKLALEHGRHQEAAIGRKAGNASLAIVYYHDVLDRTTVSGGGASGPGETKPGEEPFGMLVDPTTGSFRVFGTGYRTNGARVSFTAPITGAVWVSAEVSNGAALSSYTGGDASFRQSLAGLRAHTSQAATIALKGRLVGTGTKLRASYRWQQASLVSAVDPYSAYADQAYLSCRIRQPIRIGERLPKGLEATIDVTNLLAEGYRPFLSEDGQTLYFAQAPRTIQAGLSFNF